MTAPSAQTLLADGHPLCGDFALMTIERAGEAVPGLLMSGHAFDLRAAASATRVDLAPENPRFGLLDLLTEWDRRFEQLRELTDQIRESGLDVDRFPVLTGDLRVLPPIQRPSKMIYAAQNYPDHVQEMRSARRFGFNDSQVDTEKDFKGERADTWPYSFLKAPSSLTGPYDDIPMPPEVTKMDWEVELAFAMGRRAKRVGADEAMSYVAGFMTTNDFSARNLLFRADRDRLRSDWFSGKSHDSFAPMGPVLVPAPFVPDPENLRLHLSVNGEVKQDGNTRHLIFSPAEQIEFASRMTTLEPGDIFATGTPGGVGQGTDNFLAAGDVVEAEVEGLGVLRNHVI